MGIKFFSTPDLWDNATYQALMQGNLKLQSGQYVFCGGKAENRKSVFVGISGGTIHAIHGKDTREARAKYLAFMQGRKDAEERLKQRMFVRRATQAELDL